MARNDGWPRKVKTAYQRKENVFRIPLGTKKSPVLYKKKSSQAYLYIDVGVGLSAIDIVSVASGPSVPACVVVDDSLIGPSWETVRDLNAHHVPQHRHEHATVYPLGSTRLGQ